jgi:hypothetical protein
MKLSDGAIEIEIITREEAVAPGVPGRFLVNTSARTGE